MTYLNEQKRAIHAAPVMLAILEEPARFNELFAEYRRLDGPIDSAFLDYISPAREIWNDVSAPENIARLLALPVAFQEGVWYGLKREAQVDILQRCLAQCREKNVAKRLKRLLYELSKEGITVPHQPRKPPIYRKETAETMEHIPCFLSPTDVNDDRILIVNQPISRGYRTLQVIMQNNRIVLDFLFKETSRKKLRTMLRELQVIHDNSLTAVPDDFAYYLLLRLKDRMADADRQPPSGFVSALAQINLPKMNLAEHPYRRLVDAGAVLERMGALENSVFLLNEPEFFNWLLPPDSLKTLDLALQDLQTSGLTIDDAQLEEQMFGRIERFLNQYITGTRRRAYIERLQDEAFILANRGARDQAVTAAALALHLEDAARPVTSISFFKTMLVRSIRTFAPASEEEPPPSELIL